MTTVRVNDYFVSSILAFISRRGKPAYLVGGYLRDLLLGRPVHDVDLVVAEGGIELARAISRAFSGVFFVLDDERDVARAILTRPDGEAIDIDVARLRVPVLRDDLALRDFTINAMAAAVPPLSQLPDAQLEIIDPFDGRADLERRLVRAVSEEAFRDDPLRTLRAVRQGVEFSFELDETTCRWIRRDAHLLATVAAERIRDELMRILAAPGAWRQLRLLAHLDLLRYTLPEAQALAGVIQSPPHYLDVFDHTRAVLAHTEAVLAFIHGTSADRLPVPDAGAEFAVPAVGSEDVASDPLPASSWVPADDPGVPEAEQPDGSCGRPAKAEPAVSAPGWQWVAVQETLAPFVEELRGHLARPLAAGRTRRDLLPWAALCHDWGKATTRSVGTDWRAHFYDHEHQGASLAENRLHLLALSTHEASYVGQLVDLHMRPGHLARHYPPTPRALYRYLRDAADLAPDVTLLALADKLSTRRPQADHEQDFWPHLLDVARQILFAYFRPAAGQVLPIPLLNGRQIMAELDLTPGPQIGRLVEALREAQAVGEVTTADEARAFIRSAAANAG